MELKISDIQKIDTWLMIIDYSCEGESIEPVCGDNGVTYDNNCQLR